MCFGIDFWRKYPIEEPREMGLDEFEFARDQRILGERHEELNRGRRALPAGRAVTLAPLARHDNLRRDDGAERFTPLIASHAGRRDVRAVGLSFRDLRRCPCLVPAHASFPFEERVHNTYFPQ